MGWKRLLVSIPLGFLIMIADGLLLILVTRLYLPGHPPHWLMGAIFYFDAWPVTITQYIFGGNSGGPTFLAVASGALVDLIILSTIVYALLSWRARRKARA
jgi:hypothetical protein